MNFIVKNLFMKSEPLRLLKGRHPVLGLQKLPDTYNQLLGFVLKVIMVQILYTWHKQYFLVINTVYWRELKHLCKPSFGEVFNIKSNTII